MTKWRYGLAYYTNGTIESHPEYMNDIEGGSQSIAQFFQETGKHGWELCTLLPGEPNFPACLVFKRPMDLEAEKTNPTGGSMPIPTSVR